MRGIALRLLIVAAGLLLAGCTDTASARRIVEQEGVTNVEVTGYRVFGCLKGEDWHTGFTGTRNGRPVSGVVCGSLFTSSVRFD